MRHTSEKGTVAPRLYQRGAFFMMAIRRERISAVAGLERVHPRDVITWALEVYRGKIALACSFGGPTGMVALDMAMAIDRTLPVYFLDTGLLFSETHDIVDRVRVRYGIEPIAVKPRLSVGAQERLYGDKLWTRNPDLCCALRKSEPQRIFLREYEAWISGVRRDQTAQRSALPVVGWDTNFRLVKVSPFAHWTEEMVWTYVREHDLPYNELHDAGFPSLGCVPCTRAIVSGEELRAGRWPGSGKTECGLHATAVRGEFP